MVKELFNLKSVTVFCCAFLFFASCARIKYFGGKEKNLFFNFEPDVRVLINSPSIIDPAQTTMLILYALPNGNTIEMTAGREMSEGLDWHFDIQHIAAQTRFIRSELPDKNVIVAYLESSDKSWPLWRRKHENNGAAIARIVDYVRFETGNPLNVALSGHSGGGSFISGFIDAFDSIPDFINRIVYLDANYSFEDSLHHSQKLYNWLKTDAAHTLAVIAYDDREITLNGKKVVGSAGGTYRATQRMIQSFIERTDIVEHQSTILREFTALNKQVRFLIHTNPDTLILHTKLVEQNGFIHSILMNTNREEKNYNFFGNRAYINFISEE